jgi:hypothetical protein
LFLNTIFAAIEKFNGLLNVTGVGETKITKPNCYLQIIYALFVREGDEEVIKR